jgi:predicted membrane-bound mannosyltransferase
MSAGSMPAWVVAGDVVVVLVVAPMVVEDAIAPTAAAPVTAPSCKNRRRVKRCSTVATNPIDPPPNVDSTDDAVWRDWLVAARRPGVGAVVALTLIGGVLRFINLDQPPLLWDEAATYTRVCGTYQQLIAVLRTDGFVPLHYELYWLMGRLATLTPFVMRLIPAICGTLMIPAIYLLARQVASRRVATVAAALTAFSAFLLVYSRDAKMYMELWLAATLFVA